MGSCFDKGNILFRFESEVLHVAASELKKRCKTICESNFFLTSEKSQREKIFLLSMFLLTPGIM